jgi:hypothetical protein
MRTESPAHAAGTTHALIATHDDKNWFSLFKMSAANELYLPGRSGHDLTLSSEATRLADQGFYYRFTDAKWQTWRKPFASVWTEKKFNSPNLRGQ